MTYAGDRMILDADSHVMELAGFLDDFLEPGDRARLRRQVLDGLAPLLEDGLSKARERAADRDAASRAEERLLVDKGWAALGGFDGPERSRALDLLGFDAQLVFATFASSLFTLPRSPRRYVDRAELDTDVALAYAGASAQNRAVAAFCAADPRLLAVAYVPLIDPVRACSCAEEAIATGCAAIMVPSTAAGERSPTHPELDGFWSLLEESEVPFVLHVGGGGRLLDRAFHDNGMPVSDHLGGGENVRSKDFLAISHSPATFLGVLVLDGLFDRHPRLRGGCMEQGAGWVVSWLHQLDHAQRAFRPTEEPLRRLQDRPSAYVRRHLKFTPFPGEPVAWMMEQAGPELFLFSSDYPHPEGGRDPIGAFDETLGAVDETDRARFYGLNLAELLGPRVPRLPGA
jgi:predicted TIM-barrel fold metal-dependent hydrolase